MKHTVITITLAAALSGCAGSGFERTSDLGYPTSNDPSYQLEKSYLHEPDEQRNQAKESAAQAEQAQSKADERSQGAQQLPSLKRSQTKISNRSAINLRLDSNDQLKVAAEQMPVSQFVHYALGELLGLNYVFGPGVEKSGKTVTLNLQQPISSQRLFELTQELLTQNQFSIKQDGELLLIHQAEANGRASVQFAIGNEFNQVPNVTGQIMQAVPTKFGITLSIETTLRSLASAKITMDRDQSIIFVQGKREEVIQAMELIAMLDKPANRGKHIGLIELKFAKSADFIKELVPLMQNEGISTSSTSYLNNSLVLVGLDSVNSVVAFASDESIVKRVGFWTKLLDKPAKGNAKSYFTYHPRYARASDIGQSLGPLLGISITGGDSSNFDSETGKAPSTSRNTMGGQSEDLSMVVDERSNSIIFKATGADYQAMLPLIESLDILPKQVMLDITIVEVKLQDQFNLGVQWALQKGDFSVGTGFEVGKSGFSLSLKGDDGSALAEAFESNKLSNLLSNPSILVRDGVTAKIAVGDQISIVTGTSQSSGSEDAPITTNSEYLKTGLDVEVTPTVNAQGVVIMEISQTITNTVASSSEGGGNPDLFERSLSTEVVAESGQTILLAGLVSGTSSDEDMSVPGVSDIPLLGRLFSTEDQNGVKTELVMLITPKVIHDSSQWGDLMSDFQRGLTQITLPSQTLATDDGTVQNN
ncbi:secretin N-terminal domain-containing protein [Ferrimonas aestuarii]|nr:secretin N-terminal domain-containing protein [Ferrimonas aestuarii]